MIFTRTRFRRFAVELAVEDLFPEAEIKLPAVTATTTSAHDAAFEVRVGVVFPVLW